MPALAQGAVLTGLIEEEFSENVKASGTSLVGVMMGEAAGKTDLSRLRALLPDKHEGMKLCFSATTNDGFYWAKGELTAVKEAVGMVPIKQKGFPRFAKELAAYPAAAFAGMFAIGGDCSARDAVFVPGSFDARPSRVLRVAVNTSHSPSVLASIRAESGAVVDGECERTGGRRKAFDHICRFDLTGSAFGSGNFSLTVKSKPPGAPPRDEPYTLRLSL
jgi:hypothetical protein